jgi:thymidylate synthase (FAD)
MIIMHQKSEILRPTDWVAEAKLIELAGRVSHKSEYKITDDSYKEFIRRCIRRGHHSVLEFGTMVVKFITSRGVSHELVRHRLCSFMQESTRYVDYTDELPVIFPSSLYLHDDIGMEMAWRDTIYNTEYTYRRLVQCGVSPEIARGILPNDTKTELYVKANFREWRHIFDLRTNPAAHPDMIALITPLRDLCRQNLPEVFDTEDEDL